MLSACNESLIRATNEMQLLTEIADRGGNRRYSMAWVGMHRMMHQAVKPVGYATKILPLKIKVSWLCKRCLWSRTGRASYRTAPVVSENIELDPDFVPWLDIAKQHGYRSVSFLPLTTRATFFGVLALNSSETRPITKMRPSFCRKWPTTWLLVSSTCLHRKKPENTHGSAQGGHWYSAITGTEFFEQLAGIGGSA